MLYPRMNCDIIHMMAIELDLIIWFIGVQLCTTICQLQITTLIDVLSEQKQRKACENMRIASLPVIPWTLDRTGRLLESTHTQTFNQVPRLFNQLRFYSTLLLEKFLFRSICFTGRAIPSRFTVLRASKLIMTMYFEWCVTNKSSFHFSKLVVNIRTKVTIVAAEQLYSSWYLGKNL